MLTNLLGVLFGCHHKRFSFPQTRKTKNGVMVLPPDRFPTPSETGTYVACLDCGKEFPYDWTHMRVMKPLTILHGAK